MKMVCSSNFFSKNGMYFVLIHIGRTFQYSGIRNMLGDIRRLAVPTAY